LQISAKLKEERSVNADISWVYYIGDSVPEKIQLVFSVIAKARNIAVQIINNNIKKEKITKGWKIDDSVRKHITEAGYGSYILHRTGHSIGCDLFANGANIDNLETKENRALIAGTCFTIEPGIYFADYGMRTGINVYIDNEGAHVHTQPVQQKIVAILA
jgi:Xaa-Pro aminopeptidase